MNLTIKEHFIAKLVADGLHNRDIAGEICTTENTVKNYLRRIFDKTGMSSRLELALWYLHHFEEKVNVR